MSTEKTSTSNRVWASASIAIAAALFMTSAILGLVIFPYVQATGRFTNLWDSICSAAGLPRHPSSADPVEPDHKISQVVLSKMPKAEADSVGRGATIALQCAICHGPTGVSRADSPNLAGQYAVAIYKQLEDLRSGARSSAVMGPFAANLSDQDIRDVAAYYAYLPSVPTNHAPTAGVPAIVAYGAPLRGIAPCGSCHGSVENKAGSPWLGGQPSAYLMAQLNAFAAGIRTNDTSQQMRNIARQMTKDEIAQAAEYYAALNPDGF